VNNEDGVSHINWIFIRSVFHHSFWLLLRKVCRCIHLFVVPHFRQQTHNDSTVVASHRVASQPQCSAQPGKKKNRWPAATETSVSSFLSFFLPSFLPSFYSFALIRLPAHLAPVASVTTTRLLTFDKLYLIFLNWEEEKRFGTSLVISNGRLLLIIILL